ncbi:MAG: dihydrodipicolinate synthase family protein [Pirellulaceae bacterium]|nr:dihydrodipicolinate synthase family protein [Pirellulaceae bacterium]
MGLSNFELRGVVPVIPTPFCADESIDFDGVASCVEFAVECEVRAVCLPAYASEFYKLNELERRQVIEIAIQAAAGRVAVVAQSNHPSARCAVELAAQHEALGANVISFAIPRQFALPEADVLDYCRKICSAVSLPVLIQDFNPGGATVGVDFSRQLVEDCANFRYLKLEEPLMGGKVEAIRKATDDRVGILEGWGGMYMLDLIPAGICGLIPGLGPADLLQKVWRLGSEGNFREALKVFQIILPQLVFSLQNMELFLRIEKELLAARGVLKPTSTHVRSPTWTPDEAALTYGCELNKTVIRACEQIL